MRDVPLISESPFPPLSLLAEPHFQPILLTSNIMEIFRSEAILDRSLCLCLFIAFSYYCHYYSCLEFKYEIGAWKCNFPPFEKIMTNRQTHSGLTLQIITLPNAYQPLESENTSLTLVFNIFCRFLPYSF